MAHFLCTFVHGPAWDDARTIREQDGWTEHADFMEQLVTDGIVVVGGPVGNGHYTAHLMRAATAGEIRARMALDPWVVADRLRIGSLDAWSLWLDGRGLPAQP